MTQASVITLVESQVKARPVDLALVCDYQSFSYAALDRKSNQLALRLRTAGVSARTCVCILMDRSSEFIISLLAVLKCGAAYVPIDPLEADERLCWILSQVGPVVVLAKEEYKHRLEGLSFPVWTVRSELLKDGPATQVSSHPPLRGKDAAYVLFTSGTTGKPKGVVVEHQQLANYTIAVSKRLEFKPSMRHGFVSSMAADLGNTAIFPSLCTGGILDVIPNSLGFSPELLTHYLRQHPLDCLKITPSHLAALFECIDPQAILPSKKIILGGELLRWDLVERIRELAPGCHIYNHYGPTETTVGTLVYEVPRWGREDSYSVPIGRPLQHATVHVLDENLAPAARGTNGELYIGGGGVARGYLRDPSETARLFLPDVSHPGGRLYATGDSVRMLPSGNYEFLGRLDRQVKIQGFRVELAEIERAVALLDGVVSCAVVTQMRGSLNQLVCYLVLRTGHASCVNDFRQSLLKLLPAYMIPSVFVLTDALPLTPNGKIDYTNLSRCDLPTDSRHSRPLNARQELLAEIWKNVLGLESVGVDVSFFDLGGDSLAALKIVAQANRRGMPLTFQDLWKLQTIAALASSDDSVMDAKIE